MAFRKFAFLHFVVLFTDTAILFCYASAILSIIPKVTVYMNHCLYTGAQKTLDVGQLYCLLSLLFQIDRKAFFLFVFFFVAVPCSYKTRVFTIIPHINQILLIRGMCLLLLKPNYRTVLKKYIKINLLYTA